MATIGASDTEAIFSFKLQGFTPSWSKVFPAVPEGRRFRLRRACNAPKDPFPWGASADTSPAKPAPSSIIAALYASPYPAGDGSIAIFRSIPANNRRVRWLSANSNQ
jgi:hypothetical protein